MEEALRNRRTAFGLGLVVSAVAVGLSLITGPVPSQASEPDTLTLIMLAYALGSILLWFSWFLRPDRVIEMAGRQEPRPTLGRMAWLLSLTADAAILGSVVCGVILYQLSGELWRLALLAGVGLLGGAMLYFRIGEDIRRLQERGFGGWDPFGPSMG
ncbi:MAG TPA: hypothetical protein VNN79_06210 [Actinomycetota bacterium]|nr:hypothetical protein [Actinomycetota bacterium]